MDFFTNAVRAPGSSKHFAYIDEAYKMEAIAVFF